MNRWWLLAEDDDVDALGVGRALKALGEEVRIERAMDGEEALELLRRPGAGTPGMILVDLNMPRMGGLGLLAEIRRRPAFDLTPVVVLSTSSQASDIRGADERGGNGYVVKSLDSREFLENMRRILAFEQMAGRIQ
jgi:CheY-like chemotaxis protein